MGFFLEDPNQLGSGGGDWMVPEHVVDVLFDAIEQGEFYAICTDKYKTKNAFLGELQQSMEDVTLQRPPLSRWHPDHQDEFLKRYPEALPGPVEPNVRTFTSGKGTKASKL